MTLALIALVSLFLFEFEGFKLLLAILLGVAFNPLTMFVFFILCVLTKGSKH